MLFCFGACTVTASSQNTVFPHSWAGNWQGNLFWTQPNSQNVQVVPMQLNIHTADSAGFTWQLKYGEGETDNRPYFLFPKDSTGIHWVIDERNGIILDQYYFANRLSGVFTVMQTTIVNSYQLQGDSLVVEFNSFNKEPISQTGMGTEESPNVMSYRVTGYQRAVLRRKP
ncbi:MAG: hypothetical protein NVV59_19530 [Chitinophagaceae bacterium]|nr:hypothetical protein [Chitinophagaceae bacterium]